MLPSCLLVSFPFILQNKEKNVYFILNAGEDANILDAASNGAAQVENKNNNFCEIHASSNFDYYATLFIILLHCHW